MRAALIAELGRPPEVGEAPEPGRRGARGARRAAQSARPRGRGGAASTAGIRRCPFVPGCECVGRDAGGRVVWTFGGGLGLARNGTMAERAEPGAVVVEVPDGADPALAAALGIAGLAGWLPRRLACARPRGRPRARARRDRNSRPGRGAGGEAARRRARRRGRPRPGGARARARARRRRGGRARRRLRRADVRVRPALRRAARAGRGGGCAGRADRPARPVGGAGRDAALGGDPGQAARAVRLLGFRRPADVFAEHTPGSSGTRSPARSCSTWSGSGSTRSRPPGAAPASSSSVPRDAR